MGMARSAFAVALIAMTAALAVVQLSPLEDPAALFLPDPPVVGDGQWVHAPLKEVGRIGEGKLTKPQDVVVDVEGKYLYASCEDGWIRRVERASGHVEEWAFIKGGRPLGLAIGPGGHGLIVCEPRMGLLNVTQDGVQVLTNEAQGIKFKLTESVVVSTQDGSIFFTDASHKYSLDDHKFDIMEARPNGRLLKYNPHTQKTTTLLGPLYFASGVTLSRNEDFLVFCETTLAQCKRYWLKGEKVNNVEIFVDNLPSFPANIRSDGEGHFWISLVTRREQLNWVHKYPLLKRILAMIPDSLIIPALTKEALVLVVNEEGNILFSFGDSTGMHISHVTSSFVHGNDIYLGNLGVDFLGHIKLNDLHELTSSSK